MAMQARILPTTTDELALVRARLTQSMLPSDANTTARVCAAAVRYASEVREDGSWADVNYTTPGADDPECVLFSLA